MSFFSSIAETKTQTSRQTPIHHLIILGVIRFFGCSSFSQLWRIRGHNHYNNDKRPSSCRKFGAASEQYKYFCYRTRP